MAKVMISLPEELLERIDRAAAARKTSRSGFLQEIAAREVERPTREEIDRILKEGQELMAGSEWAGDAAALIREDRDDRKY